MIMNLPTRLRRTAMLGSCLSLAAVGCAPEETLAPDAGPANFTGDVSVDFAAATAVRIADPSGQDVGVPSAAPVGTISGFDMEAVALSYNPTTDELSVGIDTYGVGGDADGDGNSGSTSTWLNGLGGADLPNFGGTESFCVSIDVNEDGVMDVIAGVSAFTDLSGYSVSRFSGSPFNPAFAFGAPLTGHTGGVFANTSLGQPHVEFILTNFSRLGDTLGIVDGSATFKVAAYMGSQEDAGIGEDHIPGANQATQVCFDNDQDGYSTCAGDCDDNNSGVNPAATEVCDGVDNDCAGGADNGLDADGDGVSLCAGDCDDTNAAVNPNASEVCDSLDNNCNGSTDEGFDADGDGATSCAGDCDDSNASVGPNASEVCDGVDNNCDGSVDEGSDADGDGVTSCGGDCDDSNAGVSPNAAEVCDGVDNNCDGSADEGFDADADGVTSCGGDCDDNNSAVNPSAAEACDGADNNCNGSADEGLDADGDGFTYCTECDDSSAAVNPDAAESCDGVDNNCNGVVDESVDADNDGVTVCAGDCNDGDASVGPNASEVCDGIDNNCNGQVDDAADADADGFNACTDCDDTNAAIFPGAAEVCDGIDNNCDGVADSGTGVDADNDGVSDCNGDCNDNDATVYPGATEVCDGVDQDCDGVADNGFDNDGDSYTTCEGDCDDNLGWTFPGAGEACDGLDNDCDGAVDEGDTDGDGVTGCQGDCNDNDASIFPGATEVCDGADNNCNGTTDEGFDADSDGYSSCGGDCDDSNSTVYPYAVEICDDGLDNDCRGDIDNADGECNGQCEAYTLGAAADHNVFVFGDYAEGMDVAGRVAAAGNISMLGFSVGHGVGSGNVLTAGGDVDLEAGMVHGDLYYGGVAAIEESVNVLGAVAQGTPIDFAAAEGELTGLSSYLSTLANNGLTTVQPWGALELVGEDDTLNVFSVSDVDLAAANFLSINVPAGSVVVVNVNGSAIAASDFYIDLQGVEEGAVLFNMSSALTVDMEAIGWRGTILAPSADMTFYNGAFDGNIVAGSLLGNAEGHLYPFDSRILVCQ